MKEEPSTKEEPTSRFFLGAGLLPPVSSPSAFCMLCFPCLACGWNALRTPLSPPHPPPGAVATWDVKLQAMKAGEPEPASIHPLAPHEQRFLPIRRTLRLAAEHAAHPANWGRGASASVTIPGHSSAFSLLQACRYAAVEEGK